MNKEQIKEFCNSYVGSEDKVPTAMTVTEVITTLSQMTQDKYVLIDIGNEGMFSDFETDSWRGSYEYPAIFKDDEPNTVGWCVNNLKLTHGKQVTGYKGGEYVLDENYRLYVETTYSSYSAKGIIEIIELEDYVLVKTMTDMY